MKAICQNIVKKDSLYPLIKHHVPLWLADSKKNWDFQNHQNHQFSKFNGLVNGLVVLIDDKGIDVA
jgi:hypothetical protein